MLGKRSDQRGLWEADHLYRDLASRDNGRSSVPPSLLATALLLQANDRVNDAEAHRRATVDLS